MLAAIKRRSRLFKIFILVKLSRLHTEGYLWLAKQVFSRLVQELGWVLLPANRFSATFSQG